jgi:hypothetical protein
MATKKRPQTEPEVVIPPESEWTLNGLPIPEEARHLILFAMTDQGRAQANAGKVKARVQMVSDEFERNLHRIEDSVMPWEAENPIQAAIDKVRDPKLEYHLLSDRVVSREGTRGWEPVKTAEGQLVKVGNMTLAAMPKAMFAKREAHFKGLANDALRGEQEDFQVKQAKLLRDEGIPASAGGALAPGEILHAWDSESQTAIGLHSSVGNSEI